MRFYGKLPILAASLSLVTIGYADSHAGLFYLEPAALEEMKASVHVDFIHDPELDPASLYQSQNQQVFESSSKPLSSKDKQNAVKEAFVFAWEGYKKYSWGYDENRPVSNSYSNPRYFFRTNESNLSKSVL
jgi:Glycosyl hydrolase family 47